MSNSRRIIDDRLYGHFVTFTVYRRSRLIGHDHSKKIVLGVLNEELCGREALCVGFVLMLEFRTLV
jgi:putative transposase